MMVFYVVTAFDLGVRTAVLIVLEFKPFFATETLALSCFSLMFCLLVGTSHTQILTGLIIDLKTLQCKTEEGYHDLKRLQRSFNWSMVVWLVCLLGFSIFFFMIQRYKDSMLVFSCLFFVQACGLISINYILSSTLSGIFNQVPFKKERRFLKCTLLTFTVSYIIVIARTTFIYWVISQSKFEFKVWICKNNTFVNFLNVVSYTLIDLIPIGTIIFLHWRNYRKEAQKEYDLDKSGGDSTPVKNALAGNQDFFIKTASNATTVGATTAGDDLHSENPEVAVMLPFFSMPDETLSIDDETRNVFNFEHRIALQSIDNSFMDKH